MSVESCTNKGEVSTTATTKFISNLRGNSTIALGEGNIIADGLTAYALDPKGTGINNGNEYNLNGTKF